MPQIAALPLNSIDGAGLTEDSQTVLLKVRDHNDVPRMFAIPLTQIPRLIDSVCGAMANAEKNQGGVAQVLLADECQIGHGSVGQYILAVHFGGAGAKILFELPKAAAQKLSDELVARLGNAIPPKPSRSVN